MIEQFLNPIFVEALGWTLLHSLWQGAVFAILLALIFIALRSYTAQSRYIVATGLLLAFFVTATATFWMQWQDANQRFDLTMSQSITPQAGDVFTIENGASKTLESEIASVSTQPINSEMQTAEVSSHWLTVFSDYYERHLPLLVTIWLLGVLFLQLRFLGQLAYVQRIKHYGTQLFPKSWSDKIEELEGKLRIQKKVSYLTSVRIESPMVIGWLKPAVLLPRHLFKSLSETEIYEVLAHELAHIRREDFVVNLIQTLLCNIFFFHPGVWWMSGRVDDEREHCCDDLAVAATGQAASYAKTLINVSEIQLTMKGSTSLAMAFSGKSKKRDRGGFASRIRRLFMVTNGAGTFREGFATACILFTALLIGIAATGHTVHATESQDSSNIENTEIGEADNVTIANENIKDLPEKVFLKTNESDTSKKVNQFGVEGERITNWTEPPAAPELAANPERHFDIFSDNHIISNRVEPAAEPEPIPIVEPFDRMDTRIDALVMACAEGDIDFVKTLIKSGINVNEIGTEGFTPLMMAASENESEIVEYLLRKGADVNQANNGWTALIEAADEGALTSMRLLLEAGADVDYYWNQGSPTAIAMAASEGKLDCLKLLMKYGADMNGIGKSVPPLHTAAEEDKRDIISYLISQKVDVNKKDASGRTALMYAASEGKKYAVEILVDAGADLSITDRNGATAKDYTEDEDEYDKRDYLGKEKRPAIHQATLDGLIEQVERMVERGTDVDTRDDYGRTPLHIASAQNHNIDMRVLIDLGANINAQDKQGRTPMMYAAADGKRDGVVLLVSKVADVNIHDDDGMRALEWARAGGNEDLIKFLDLITDSKDGARSINYGRDSWSNNNQEEFDENLQERIEKIIKEVNKAVNKETSKEVIKKNETVHIAKDGLHLRQYDMKEEATALMDAVRHGSVDQCRVLLNNGADVNATDDTGQTALMVASMSNRQDMLNFLIDTGADVNMNSSSGLTALHYAALENHVEIAQILLNNNATVDAMMSYSSSDGNTSKELLAWEYIGATPLLIAVEANNLEIAKALISAGANPKHRLTKIEYRLKKGSNSYLGLSEVIGIDGDFKKDAEIKISDDTWTPKKQAQQMNKPKILNLFPK